MSTRLDNFEHAFGEHGAGCRRECECGRIFYNLDGDWDYEEGELELLANNPKATDLDYAPAYVFLEGRHYVNACDCWHKRAEHVMQWIENHGHSIAEWLTLERKRKQANANNSPVVEDP